MSWLTDIFGGEYKLLAIGIAIAVIFAAGGAGGYKLAAWHYDGQVAAAKADTIAAKKDTDAARVNAAQWQASYTALQAAGKRQNDAVAAFAAASDARAKAAEVAEAAAKKRADAADARAKQILQSQPPPGLDLCTAARQAFDAELKEERAQP
jgi:hypothetical protein